MARLIDADELLQEFETENVAHRSDMWHITGIKAFIQCQPTAYNVEKVVDELQSYKQGNCTNDCEHFDNGVKYGYEKGIDDFLREIKIDVIATTFGLRICDAERIAQQLKAGGEDAQA